MIHQLQDRVGRHPDTRFDALCQFVAVPRGPPWDAARTPVVPLHACDITTDAIRLLGCKERQCQVDAVHIKESRVGTTIHYVGVAVPVGVHGE